MEHVASFRTSTKLSALTMTPNSGVMHPCSYLYLTTTSETAIPAGSSSELLVPTILPNPGGTPRPVTYTSTLSLRPTPGSDRSPVNESPAGAIAGALVGVMVVVVAAIAVVLLVVLVQRKRQRKLPHEPDTQEKTLENPIYAGCVSHVHGVWLLYVSS